MSKLVYHEHSSNDISKSFDNVVVIDLITAVSKESFVLLAFLDMSRLV